MDGMGSSLRMATTRMAIRITTAGTMAAITTASSIRIVRSTAVAPDSCCRTERLRRGTSDITKPAMATLCPFPERRRLEEGVTMRRSDGRQ